MQNSYKVVFRRYEDEWEAYAVDHGAFGYGESIYEAREDFKEALSLLLEVPVEEIHLVEYLEKCVYEESESNPAIWVRTRQDWDDSGRMLERRGIRQIICDHLQESPESLATFGGETSAFGDVIAAVCFSDDLLEDLLEQVGEADRLFVCMPTEEGLLWNCIFTAEADNLPAEKINIHSLDLPSLPTVGDFMMATGVTSKATNPKKILVSA